MESSWKKFSTVCFKIAHVFRRKFIIGFVVFLFLTRSVPGKNITLVRIGEYCCRSKTVKCRIYSPTRSLMVFQICCRHHFPWHGNLNAVINSDYGGSSADSLLSKAKFYPYFFNHSKRSAFLWERNITADLFRSVIGHALTACN